MKDNFERCLAFVLREEGGNSDDPQDHGGRTSRGITQAVYDAWRRRSGLPLADVWRAPQSEIVAIYRAQYWQPYCDDIPAGLDLAFFDFCVNAGRTQAVKTLQRCLNVTADAMIGQVTLDALARVEDIGALIHDYCERRCAFYRALRQFPRYGRGWLARTARCEREAADMAGAAMHPVGAVAARRADPGDPAEPIVSPEIGAATSTGSAAAAGVTDQIQTVYGQLSAFADTLVIVKYLLIALALIGFGVTMYGLVRRRTNKESIG